MRNVLFCFETPLDDEAGALDIERESEGGRRAREREREPTPDREKQIGPTEAHWRQTTGTLAEALAQ